MVLLGCDSKRIFEKNYRIVRNTWDQADPVRIRAEINDTLIPYNFYLNIRNTTDYSYSNLYLFVTTQYPSGKVSRDTLDCPLADLKGKWLGSGFGKVKNMRILLKSRMYFREKGAYTFTLEQAMRTKFLTGIADVGIRIEKY